jgi:hypothetical protein
MQQIKTPETITYYQGGKWYEQPQEDYETFRHYREAGVNHPAREIPQEPYPIPGE